MPLEPITVNLSDGQKLEVLKRFLHKYRDELDHLENEIREIKTELAEYEFVVKYLGEQPEVVALKNRGEQLAKLEQRRNHYGMLMDRLKQVLPKQGSDQPATFQRF